MKKLISMILTLAVALSLCACNTEKPDMDRDDSAPVTPSYIEDTTPPSSEPAEPEIPNLSMFVGQWVYMATNSTERDDTFTINADGTLEYEDKIYTWSAQLASENANYEMLIHVMCPSEPGNPYATTLYPYTIRLTRTPENTYVANLGRTGGMGTGTDFYRVGDYEVVELTNENVTDYLESEEYFSYGTDDFGYTCRIYRYTTVQFKEGVGFPSWCVANFVYRITEKEVTFDEKPEGYTLGQTMTCYEGQPNVWETSTPNVTGKYPYSFYFTYAWFGNEGGEKLTETVSFHELLGADKIVGKVYIPVEK